MIRITDKHNCCGCSACFSICPKKCITMQADSEGFLYPLVNETDCIDCGLCENVCNELHPYDKREPLKVLAAINKDVEVRLKSSSGGIFYILAEKTISEGGVVFGARFDEQWQVVIDYAETMKGVEAFMGSKYVQARMATAYTDAKRFLAEGRKVLFSGTPCQIAGLHHFLRKHYDNLLTVDLVCHGTPSPKVWGMYLEKAIREGRRISFHLRYNDEDGSTSMLSPVSQNHYMKAFLRDMILRPSCYDCKAKECSSQSDLTIADFWGIQGVFPEMDDDKGTGMVFINTEKGGRALDLSRMELRETTYDRIKPLNPACYRSAAPHPKRESFFARLGSEDLIKLIDDCTKPSAKQLVRRRIGQCKSLIKRLLKRMIGKSEAQPMISEPSRSSDILTLPSNPEVVSICFRNKEAGWKGYHIEIRVINQNHHEEILSDFDYS